MNGEGRVLAPPSKVSPYFDHRLLQEFQHGLPQGIFHRQSSELTHVVSNCALDRTGKGGSTAVLDVLQPNSQQHLRFLDSNDDDRNASQTHFYRIVFKGVVALLKSPETDSPRNGSYLSYGDIFLGSQVDDFDAKKAVRVHSVLTGGYAVSAETASDASCFPTPNPANVMGISGYVFSAQNDNVIAELLQFTPRAEKRTFWYRIISSTPLPILTGPALDAPKTKAVVLPGTVQEISVRVCVESDISFLRLSHRRGWIADRKVSTKSHMSVAVVKEMNSEMDNNSADGSSVGSVATSLSARRRHRPPRSRRDAAAKDGDKTLPRHIAGRVNFPLQKQVNDGSDRSIAPSSNVSILSDDSSQTASQRRTRPSSPDASFSTHKSATSLSNQQNSAAHTPALNYYLMRVTAPNGLKILDAPQFQVNRLIRSGKLQQHAVSSSHMVSQMESNPLKRHHSIFQTMSGRLTTTGPSQAGNPAVFDANSKTRVLPRGAVFEASTRMETTGSYSQGSGLIKLSDNSGWAVVPRQPELDEQYRSFTGGMASVKEGESTRAYEEVGSAVLQTNSNGTSDFSQTNRSSNWLRVIVRTGLTVACPPPIPTASDDVTSPISSRGSSAITSSNHGSNTGLLAGNDSDVASSVGSAFLDAMFRTPKKKEIDVIKEPLPRPNPEKLLQVNTIPCGMFLEVEDWSDFLTSQYTEREYARLCGGQGWMPLTVGGKPTTATVTRPEFRYGSHWFRVQSSHGLKVRLGPSKRAPSIKSEDGAYFRFECGEFLRASEIITVFSDKREPIESFVKLYRNRHVRLHHSHEDIRFLTSLTTQAEWVQVYSEDELFLEECAAEPRIERHKQGWRYNVVPEDGVAVRKGPSFASEKTGILLFGGESVVVNERVTPAGDKITWLRMKDGQGWIHNVDDAGEHIMIAHSLRHRAQTTRPRKPVMPKEGNEIAYNAIIARLFHTEDGYRPSEDVKGARR